MKTLKITLLIAIFLCSLIFTILNQMTVSPGTISGNGNPALLIAWILLPILFLMIAIWIRMIRFYSIKTSRLFAALIFTFSHLIIGFIYQYKELAKYRNVIEEEIIRRNGNIDKQYLQDITSGLTIHVNNQYFNLNTFFMFLSLSALIALSYQLLVVFENRSISRKKRISE